MKPELSAYILCGGKSSRMGEEKGLVGFHGKSFVQWILDALYPLVSHPVLVTKNPEYRFFHLEMVSDLVEDKGPVGGIFTALSHANSDPVLILSCDIPKITTEALTFLVKKSLEAPHKITFLSDGKNDYPLIGVYPKYAQEFFGKSVSNGALKLRRLVESLPHQRIELKPDGISPLQNINTKTDLIALSQTY